MDSRDNIAAQGSAPGSQLRATVALLVSLLLATSIAHGNEPGLSDPMRPNWYGLKAKAKKQPRIPELSSIIASDDRRLAVINGKVMREGERKNGVLLRQVLPDRVLVVTADRQLHALKLSKPKIGKEQR
ncbi:MAG: hypothetical protein ACR2PZ_22700 [Pseudomonadales bacterium]